MEILLLAIALILESIIIIIQKREYDKLVTSNSVLQHIIEDKLLIIKELAGYLKSKEQEILELKSNNNDKE